MVIDSYRDIAVGHKCNWDFQRLQNFSKGNDAP